VTIIYDGTRLVGITLLNIRFAGKKLEMNIVIELTALYPSKAIEASRMRPLIRWNRRVKGGRRVILKTELTCKVVKLKAAVDFPISSLRNE
jgi:hypothetical protein